MAAQATCSELMAACGYLLTGFVLCVNSLKTRELNFGSARWLILGGVFAVGIGHIAMLFVWDKPVLAADIRLTYDAMLLAVSLLLWPRLNHVIKQVKSATDRKITRKLDEAAAIMAHSRQWLELAEQIARVGHWRYTIPNGEVFWSDEVYRIYGMEKNEIKPDLDYSISAHHPDDREQLMQLLNKAIHDREPYEMQARLFRTDGEMRHVITRGHPQIDEFGELRSIFGVFVDVTEQKLAERKLQCALSALEQANAALTELAMEDSLTGLGNRRKFDVSLEQEFSRALRGTTALGLVMIDLDGFKSYNDHYGHPAGDVCLRQVAQAILSVPARPGDLVARYGGEEIAILLPLADEQGARVMAQLACDAVRMLGLPHHGSPSGIITVSCGAASLLPSAGLDKPGHLVALADSALYEAKRAGRNQVVCHGDPLCLAH